MPAHGDVDTTGRVWCEIHAAWVDCEDRHLDEVMGRPPLLREIPHQIGGGDAVWVPRDPETTPKDGGKC